MPRAREGTNPGHSQGEEASELGGSMSVLVLRVLRQENTPDPFSQRGDETIVGISGVEHDADPDAAWQSGFEMKHSTTQPT